MKKFALLMGVGLVLAIPETSLAQRGGWHRVGYQTYVYIQNHHSRGPRWINVNGVRVEQWAQSTPVYVFIDGQRYERRTVRRNGVRTYVLVPSY